MRRQGFVLLVWIALTCSLWNCRSNAVFEPSRDAFENTTPPGTFRVDSSLFADYTEITNFYWLEYLFWLSQAYGYGSHEYKAALPDTSVWIGYAQNDSSRVTCYMRHPAYRDYPVVGVTAEQALAYSKWRSDRVLEVFLIRESVIPWRPTGTVPEPFTIEWFYAQDSLKRFHVVPYPEYSLPTREERERLEHAAEVVNSKALRRCRRSWCDALKRPRLRYLPIDTAICAIEPTAPVDCYCRKYGVFHLIGNVREIAADTTLTFGGGWFDPPDSLNTEYVLPKGPPNAWTGFRNVCHWRNYTGPRP